MGLSDLRRAWEGFNCTLADLPAKLRKHADVVRLAGAPGDALLQGEGAPHAVLTVFTEDPLGAVVYVVPTALIDAPLDAALTAIDGRMFGDPGDLKVAQWDGAVLAMSALGGMELSDAEAMAAWAADGDSSVTAEQIEAYWGRFETLWARTWADLEKKVTRHYRFYRAQ